MKQTKNETLEKVASPLEFLPFNLKGLTVIWPHNNKEQIAPCASKDEVISNIPVRFVKGKRLNLK